MKDKINHLEAIIFDLDDTLIDTYAALITQLEYKAAEKMVRLDASLPPPGALAALMLKIRRITPYKFEKEMKKQIPGITKNLLKVRRDVFANIPLNGLVIDPEVKLFIKKLNSKYHLYLVTEGDADFQNAKIDHLGIRSCFREILIVSKNNKKVALKTILKKNRKKNKKEALKTILKKNRYAPGAVLVVGNRLDKEIRAAARLGIHTVWIKQGEGCDMIPDDQVGRPDFIIENIFELKQAININI